MIEDLRHRPEDALLEADLCIVGAGAAGIALARELAAEHQNDVVVLESGGLKRHAATDGLNDGDSQGLPPASLTEGRGRLFGGATALWAGQCIPPEPETFRERPWIPHSGWPFAASELEPYIHRAEALFQIEGEVYDERTWDSFAVRRVATDADRLEHRFTVWCPEPHLGRLYRKSLDAAANVKVLLNATATEIVTTSDGRRFDSVRVATPEGRTAVVRARACVLCGGAIENSRLLLASDRHSPGGIGNEHDLVGRFFQEHPNGHTAVIADGDVRRLQELYGLFYRGRVRYLPRLTLSFGEQRSREVLACAAHPVFRFDQGSGIEAARRVYRAARAGHVPDRLRLELGRMARDARSVGQVARRRLTHGRSADLEPAQITLQTYTEQAPNPDSRVTLSDRRDALGVPLPRVDWRLTEQDRRTTEAMVDTVAAEFRRLGLGEVRAEQWLTGGDWAGHLNDAYHHMGTTRLGSSPLDSVVDSDGQVHRVSGLYVTGASVFPIAGFANPTLLIAALAIRLGDHLKKRLGSQWPATTSI